MYVALGHVTVSWNMVVFPIATGRAREALKIVWELERHSHVHGNLEMADGRGMSMLMPRR